MTPINLFGILCVWFSGFCSGIIFLGWYLYRKEFETMTWILIAKLGVTSILSLIIGITILFN